MVTKGVFQKSKDETLFSKVTIDPKLGTITWPGGLDLDPEYIYFLAFKGDQALQKRFKDWGYS